LWAEKYDKSDTDSDEEGDEIYDDMMTHEQIQQMFSEESDNDECLGFESILLNLGHLIRGFDSRGRGLLVLETGASYTRVYTVNLVCLHRTDIRPT